MGKFLDECDYLIHLVRCAIHDLQPQELPEGLDFQRVYDWGVYHHIANIAFCSVEKLKKKPEAQLYGQWQHSQDLAVVRDIIQGVEAKQLVKALDSAGIRTLEVQGTKLKPLYPQSHWRTMSDIDFIVDPENIPKAREVLEALDYQCQLAHEVELHAHRPPHINIELHTEFFWEESPYSRVLHSPFASVNEAGECDPDTLYLYNLLHIAKHYFGGGCGIRRVLDVYYLNEKLAKSIHQEAIQEALERAGAAEFASELSSLAKAWFAEGKQVRSPMAVYIINSGLHGNRPNELKHHLEKTFDDTARHARLRYFLGRFFGTGGELKKKYPVLQRHMYLYPFCWLHRSFRALQPRRFKRIKKEIRAVLKKNKA